MNKNLVFLTHVPLSSCYGSSASLRGLILGLKSIKTPVNPIIIFQPWRGFFSKTTIDNLTSIPCPLPCFRSYKGYSPKALSSFLLGILDLFSVLFIPFLIIALRKYKPGCVHFNSIILSPLIPLVRFCLPRSYIVLHLRELPLLRYTFIYSILWSFADLLVSIDGASHKLATDVLSSSNLKVPSLKLMYNPINPSFNLYPSLFLDILGKFPNKLVFAFVGRLSPEKSVDIIISDFIAADDHDSLLLLVGSGEAHYVRHLSSLASGFENIIFLPPQYDLVSSGFYNIIDVLIRCDPSPCLGRTVLEALSHSKHVLINGSKDDFGDVDLISYYSDLMHFYGQSSMAPHVLCLSKFLRSSLAKSNQISFADSPLSDSDQYAAAFSSFLRL